jgi:hypothetical protein
MRENSPKTDSCPNWPFDFRGKRLRPWHPRGISRSRIPPLDSKGRREHDMATCPQELTPDPPTPRIGVKFPQPPSIPVSVFHACPLPLLPRESCLPLRCVTHLLGCHTTRRFPDSARTMTVRNRARMRIGFSLRGTRPIRIATRGRGRVDVPEGLLTSPTRISRRPRIQRK